MPRSAPKPLPEAVDAGAWTIEALPGDGREASAVLNGLAGCGGTLRVPLGGGARERYVRAHELGHAAWSPRRQFPSHLAETTMQHAEDARIGRRLAAVGIHAEVRLLADEEIAHTAAGLADGTYARIDVASMLLATTGVPDGEELARAVAGVEPALPPRVAEVWEETMGREEKPEFDRAVEAAEMLTRIFGRSTRSPASDASVASELVGIGLAAPCAPVQDGDGHPGWGRLDVVERPRPLQLAPRMAGVRWRAAEQGTRLGDPSRFYRDARGWRARHRRRHAGGTVLIDCSGSMSLTAEMIEELVTVNPAALIATYSGNEDRRSGRLQVVARGGRRVRPEHVCPPGNYNVCDGPALDWLGRQPAPRIWVSDGRVTGLDEGRTPALAADANARCRRHAIRRVETADALMGEWREAGRVRD